MTPQEAPTLGAMFHARARASPEAIAYIEYSHPLGKWFRHGWQSMEHRAGRMQGLLRSLGLVAGDRIGIMAHGGTYWAEIDLAAAGLGIVTVPLYHRDHAGNVAYIAQRTGMRALFLGGPSQWQEISAGEPLPASVERILSAVEVPDSPVEPCLLAAEEFEGTEYAVEETDPGRVATVVFTSGTTGPPKGVELTHANILSNVSAATAAVPIDDRDQLLSFLPLSHMFERTVGYYAPMMHGAAVAFARSVQTLREDLVIEPPTLLVAVPRVYEKIYQGLRARAPFASGPGRFLMWLITRAGARSPWAVLRPVTRTLFGPRLRAAFGGRLRAAITGGAALDPEIARFFHGMGVVILQGYGLTETSPVVSVNRLEDLRADSVGVPLDGVEVRLGEHDELLVRGPGVLHDYLEDPEATAQAVDGQGWFHTGDQAAIGADGHIRIVGRIKEILVLSTGEKVPPADVEEALCHHPKVQQAFVCGEGRKFLSAVVVAPGASEGELLGAVPKLLREFPAYARVQRIHVEDHAWSSDNDMLTVTLKLRRPALAEKYAAEVAAFYEGS